MAKKNVLKMKPKGKSVPKGKKAPGKKKQTKKEIAALLKKGPIKRQLKDVPLPGMETVRIAELDSLAAQVSDWRSQKNAAVEGEKALMPSVKVVMEKHGRVYWKAHGIEFVYEAGVATVKTRVAKKDKPATDDAEEPDVVAQDAEDAVTGEELEP